MVESNQEIRIGIVRPKLAEMLLDTVYSPVFPFLTIRFESKDEPPSPVTVNVHPKLFEVLRGVFGGDFALQYLDLRTGRIEPWTKDMLVAFRLMQKLGLVSNLDDWVKAGHETAVALLSKKRIPKPSEKNVKALKTATDILNATGILHDIELSSSLLAVAEEATNSGERDRDTLIYRVAMAIYHSKRLSGESALLGIEDPGSLYLSLVRNLQGSKELGFLLKEIQETQAESRPELVRVFICFVAATYLYEISLKA